MGPKGSHIIDFWLTFSNHRTQIQNLDDLDFPCPFHVHVKMICDLRTWH